MKLYNKLEDMIRKYIVRPIAIVGLVGVLGVGGHVYSKNVAIDNQGNYVVISSNGIKKYDINGNIVREFVDSFGGRVIPSVAMNKNTEEFVATFKRDNIYAQRFDKDGNKIEGEFLVTSYPTIGYSETLMDGEGNFMIAWTTDWPGFPGNTFAKGYDKEGNEIREEFTIRNDWIVDDIEMWENGDFLVTWGCHSDKIEGQRYDKNGNPVGEIFTVSEAKRPGALEMCNSSVGVNDNGYTITWRDHDNNGYGIYAQRFDNDGNKIGEEFQVNRVIEGDQLWPDIAMDKDGNYVILWTHRHTFNPSGDDAEVYAQRFDNDGNKIGEEFQVLGSNIAMNDSGYFVIEDKMHHFSDVFFRRGDANRDKEYDISDPVSTLLYLFSDLELKCLDAADSNDDGKLDVSDPIYSLHHLFLGGQAPPFPYPWPGKDYTQDDLDCKEY